MHESLFPSREQGFEPQDELTLDLMDLEDTILDLEEASFVTQNSLVFLKTLLARLLPRIRGGR